ncbi:serine hydrolase [Novosphingobium mangrovi (ex Huang et al. 2023)]|uniref:Serine hydrolase n=1 Tax=Novosphingobium mangrovi (ex Huang et al. 2023) TaxID=2976432 RepID=A0ABT2I721_9SPHN|nr:serine hydrolase [Novosphingobium mangrovi (ex Huang et al. 2023)]MCT2400621.1 serine hydrolase [Novosphingobium mangrovi (ex Huang et al. 2023)]
MVRRLAVSFSLGLLTVASPALCDDRAFEADAAAVYQGLAPTGMAVAVVKDGRLAFDHGFGTREVGKAQPVDADTVFPIHSMTKAFTAAALAVLIDEGKLNWDDKVVAHLPEFAMSDPYVTREMTVRDLLVHRSGLSLGAGDLLLWPDAKATPGEVVAALRHLPLATGFRERFTYDNILYMVAGEVVARVSGMSWADFVEQRLFVPLGMTSCSADPARPRPLPTALQHSRAGADAKVEALTDLDAVADPAGSISCSARDIARWAVFQMGDGTAASGVRVLTPERLHEMQEGDVIMHTSGMRRRLANSHLTAYGLGWTVSDFAGERLVEHGGAGPGGLTNLVMLPDRKVAVVVLTNDIVPAHLLAYQLADRAVRGENAADWNGEVVRRYREFMAEKTKASDAAATADAATGMATAHPLSAYAGTYRDPWYGDIVVRETGSGLEIHLTRSKLLRGPLVHRDGETFVARWPDRHLNADAVVTFVADGEGRPARLTIAPATPDVDFSFDYRDLHPVRVAGHSWSALP